MADPWARFAEAPAENAQAPQGENFTQFADATPSGTPNNAYLKELQRRFDAPDANAENLSSYVRSQGFDPAATDFAKALEAKKSGSRVQFVPNGAVQVTPADGNEGGFLHDLAVGARGAAAGLTDVLSMGNVFGIAADAYNRFTGNPSLSQREEGVWGDTGTPRSAGEHMVYQTVRGATAAAPLGFAGPAALALATASGASSGAAGEATRQAGYGVPAQIAASVLAGGIPIGVKAAGSAAARALSTAESVASRVPAAVAVSEAGGLTQEGHEIALRTGVPEDDLAQAYARQQRQTTPPSAPQDAAPVNPPVSAEQPPSAPVQDPAAPEPPRPVYADAQEEGVPLSRGQATQNFETQNDENALRVSASREGSQAQQWFGEQQDRLQSMVQRFRDGFGQDAGTAADRGQQVRNAVTSLRNEGQQGVSALYRHAEQLGGEGLRLNTDGIRAAATEVLYDAAVPDGIKAAVKQELARYGVIGTPEATNEAGVTRVKLDDGSSINIHGPVQELTAANAEDFRRAINRFYDPQRPNLSGQSIKPAIDQSLEDALAGNDTPISGAYQNARDAHRVQRGTFNAGDIIQSLHANRIGTKTPVLLPERAIAQTIGSGKNALSNLRTVRGLLTSSSSPEAQQAWRAIQHQSLADIFDAAYSRNVNNGVNQTGDVISGARLNSAIEKFGTDKLRLVLSPEDFNGLMKIRRIIGAATIPITGTTNPSGTATKLINYMRSGTLRFAGHIPGLGGASNLVAGLASKAKEIAATRRTLEGITSYSGPEASAASDARAQAFIRQYIDLGTRGALVPSTINLSASRTQK